MKKLKKQEKAGKKNKMSKEEKQALFQGSRHASIITGWGNRVYSIVSGKSKGKKETKPVPEKKQPYVNKTPVGEKKDMSEPMVVYCRGKMVG